MSTIEPSTTAAAVTAAVYVALLAGHHLGDYPIQRDSDAQSKGIPADEVIAAGTPWHTGWSSITRHVLSYLACQAGALWLVSLVAPLTLAGVWTALVVSGTTHAVIDRRWIVQAIIRAKGGCQHWPGAATCIDQALHHVMILVAAVGAARITTLAGAVYETAIGAAGIGAALLWEHRHARRVQARQLAATSRRDR
ncbi:DUF3307 domain-containing protein [Actinoplanes siamensis]|uniref:DUF3307 domain-containing protein n=1 Tax=Actinoplanes siamensis TaxID=1223317 RepID=A0A919NDL2_9ACTN|nr:DUF3307 domain-containing protein [Actinoplanes siamensis]GIF08867.1 hypothetical protein Asi03nite_64050 [Actinoplanes siamensis]